MFKSVWQRGCSILGASGVDGLGRSLRDPAVLTWEHHTHASKATSAQLLQIDPGVAAERDSGGFELRKGLFGRVAWFECGKRSRSPVSMDVLLWIPTVMPTEGSLAPSR